MEKALPRPPYALEVVRHQLRQHHSLLEHALRLANSSAGPPRAASPLKPSDLHALRLLEAGDVA